MPPSRDSDPVLRTDPLSRQQAIVAPRRARRPRQDGDSSGRCPFCPGNEADTPPPLLVLPEGAADGWEVRVVGNRFPLVAGPPGRRRARASAEPFLPAEVSLGAHEVVIETPDHDLEMEQRTPAQLALTLHAYQQRLRALSELPGVRQVIIFKNRGEAAGISLRHPHSQIVALSSLPEDVRRRAQRLRRHFRRTGRCLACRVIESERGGSRAVFEQDGFLAVTPFAPWGSAQVRLLPIEHATSFALAPQETVEALSRALLRLLRSLDAVFERPAFNLVLWEPPLPARPAEAFHWYLEVTPRLAVPGGFELATGVQISTRPPEEVSSELRHAGN